VKQIIDAEQLRELTEGQKKKLREWWKPQFGDVLNSVKCGGWHLPKYDGSPTYYYPLRVRERVVGACGGCWDCESVIDDGDNPAVMPDKTSLPLLSVGQMIELLDNIFQKDKSIEHNKMQININKTILWIGNSQLCDALWQAVKAVL